MQGKKIIVTTLIISMLLSITGCGSSGEFVQALGRAFVKTVANRGAEDEDAEKSEELSSLPESDTASDEEDAVLVGGDLEDGPDHDDHAPEGTPEATPRAEATPREGVTSLDDVFSSGRDDPEQDVDGGSFLYFEDDVLSYDEFILENLDKCKSDLAADKGSIQSEIDSDTIQWMNATYALITESNGGNRMLVGGMERNTINAVFMRYQLYAGWGIEDPESADETIEWLRDEGHRHDYVDLEEFFEKTGLFSLSKEEFDLTIKETFGDYAVNCMQTVYDCHMACGEKGILAWDLCRLNQVASWCYVAGYYTLDEALEIQYQNSLLMQESFSSWDDMMESYLYGFRFWNGDSGDSRSSETAKRRNIYDSLKKISDGPYSGDFNRKLKRSWMTGA